MIEILPGPQQLFAAWFTFAEAGAKLGASEHRWLTAQGSYLDDTASLVISLTAGGRFDDPLPPETSNVGSATLTFSGCHSARFEYALDEGQTGSIPLARVAPDADCTPFEEVKK